MFCAAAQLWHPLLVPLPQSFALDVRLGVQLHGTAAPAQHACVCHGEFTGEGCEAPLFSCPLNCSSFCFLSRPYHVSFSFLAYCLPQSYFYSSIIV